MTQAPVEILPEPGAFIGDRVVTDGSGGEHEHVYAATGRATKRVPLPGAHEIELAVGAARDALAVWRSMPRNQRRQLFLTLAAALRREADALGRITTIDSSVPKTMARTAAFEAADTFEYSAGWIDRIGGEVRPTWPEPTHDYTLDEPYGVVSATIPFNSPVHASAMVLGPVLAAGNTAVVKPPEISPFSVIRFGELFLEAGFPPGVVNFVPGPPQAGELLVRSPGVDKVFFMGSTKSAKYVMIAAAESGLKPLALELGGKSPVLVFEDADVDRAAEMTVRGGLGLGGQGCVLGTRLLVHAPVYDAFVEKAAKLAPELEVGDPALETTMIGPVVNERACERIMGVISQAVDEREGILVAGGHRLGGEFADGYFIAPTLFADVDHSTPLAREEIFGPVLAIIPFQTEEEGLRMANDSPYGLGAYIHSNDARRVHRLAASIEAGSVYVNGMPTTGIPPGVPFGGVKQSGFGRLGGIEAIREFTRPKNVTMFL